jgi:DNA helicase-2/ATP-dependent DNA helicase PcrA
VGVVRLFVAPQNTADKTVLEAAIARRMAEITGDEVWGLGSEEIKRLALEHLMSARRFGFKEFFQPLYSVERIRTSFLQGSGAGIGFFTREILPLVNALRASDRFAVAANVRRSSPLLERKALEDAGDKQSETLSKVKAACEGLLALVSADEQPPARAVLSYVAKTHLFTIPDVLAPFTKQDEIQGAPHRESADDPIEEEEVDLKTELGGWREALNAPFDQIEKYDRYVKGISQFDTHQGVKGLEFKRVMVTVSDEEARGFMFAYDKLFGVKAKSKTDLENEGAGKETTIDRTRRLFYVTCSRTEESLAIVYYTTDPASAREAIIAHGWLESNEIELVQ